MAAMKFYQRNILIFLFPWLLTMSLPAQIFQVDDYLFKSEVFTMGEEGYNNYRIPSIVQAKDGTLIAIVEGRRDRRGDPGAGHIDLVYKLSYDGGKNWSPLHLFEKSREGWSASNPTTVVDNNNGRILILYNVWKPGRGGRNSRPGTLDCQLWMRYSNDNGSTWSDAKDITRQGRDVERWGRAVFGPGHGIQTRTGRLVIPVNAPGKFDDDPLASASFALYSDDGGMTWNRGEQINAPTNENVIVELDDGSLMMDARPNGTLNTRWVAISHDQGQTWSEPRPGLVAPVICASIIRYPRPGDSNNSLLLWSGIKGPEFMNRDPGRNIDHSNRILRTNLVMRVSVDHGQSFPAAIWIHRGPAACAVMTLIDKLDVGIIWEGGKIPTGTVHFTRIPREVIQKFIDLSQPK